ncbi:hypothetical protein [Chitinilyticum litopenaei]|uniref:hypothetical protein n=1 Tax=Chitinilyticum litopenaei TaxID=1121276 RepID=UPI000429BC6B|nr:hypothetical protein [Chitinilyticum litopenaei]
MRTINFRQRGAFTLIAAVLSLVLTSLVLVYVHRTSLTEISMVRQMNRVEIAREAAEAGSETMLALLNASQASYVSGWSASSAAKAQMLATIDNNAAGAIVTYVASSAVSSGNDRRYGSIYEVRVCRSGASLTTPCSLTPTATASSVDASSLIRIEAIGYTNCSDLTASATCSVTAQNVSLVGKSALFRSFPSDAILAVGNVSLGGSTCVENSSGSGYAVHAGLDLTNSPNNWQGQNCYSTNGKGTYGSGFDRDGGLATMQGTPGADPTTSPGSFPLFEYLYGVDSQTLYNSSSTTKMGNQFPTEAQANNTSNGPVFWSTGTFSVNGNNTYGSPENPVVLVVNGTLSLNGNVTIYGIVHVIGSVSISGNLTVEGTLVNDGSTAFGNGNNKVRYNPDIFNNLNRKADGYARAAGSWRDW